MNPIITLLLILMGFIVTLFVLMILRLNMVINYYNRLRI